MNHIIQIYNVKKSLSHKVLGILRLLLDLNCTKKLKIRRPYTSIPSRIAPYLKWSNRFLFLFSVHFLKVLAEQL